MERYLFYTIVGQQFEENVSIEEFFSFMTTDFYHKFQMVQEKF